jgi:thymidine kinase
VLLGETQEYEPLSRAAYYKAVKNKKKQILSSEENKSASKDPE